MELRTPRLRLRPYDAADFDLLFRQLVLDPVVVRFWADYADPALTDTDRRAMAERDLGSWLEEAMVAGYPSWVIEALDPTGGSDGEFVGVIGVYAAQNHLGPEPEVGCLLASRHHGRGLATEALRAVMADAAERLGIRDLAAIIDDANAASIHFVEKCGFVLEQSFVADDGSPCRRYVRRADRAGLR